MIRRVRMRIHPLDYLFYDKIELQEVLSVRVRGMAVGWMSVEVLAWSPGSMGCGKICPTGKTPYPMLLHPQTQI